MSTRSEADKFLQEQTRLLEMARQYNAEEHQLRQLESRLTADEVILQEIGEVHFDEQAYLQLKSKLAAQESRYREFLSQQNYHFANDLEK